MSRTRLRLNNCSRRFLVLVPRLANLPLQILISSYLIPMNGTLLLNDRWGVTRRFPRLTLVRLVVAFCVMRLSVIQPLVLSAWSETPRHLTITPCSYSFSDDCRRVCK